jgi:hypothetical protein
MEIDSDTHNIVDTGTSGAIYDGALMKASNKDLPENDSNVLF